MKLTPQISFNESELQKLLAESLHKWCGGYQSGLKVDINCNRDGQASGNAFMLLEGENSIISLSHAVIAAGICQALAAKGEAIGDGSLTFKYNEGHGHGRSSSVSATATPASADASLPDGSATEASAAKAGVVNFPGTVSVNFGIDALTDLLKAAAKRSGNKPTYASVAFTNHKTCTASISVETNSGRTGTIALNSTELIEVLSEELTSRGYSLAHDGFSFNYTEGGHGSRSGTSVTVTCTGFPIGKA
jgi:hypothetical protein